MNVNSRRILIWLIVVSITKIIAAQQSDENSNQKFILGVIDYYDSTKIHNTFVPIVKEISSVINQEPQLIIYNYDKLKTALVNNEIDMAIFSPNAYINAKKEYDKLGYRNISAFATHLANGKKGYYGVIVVHDSSQCKTLKDLVGKRFLFTHMLSTSGYKLPYSIFIQNGIEPSTDFISDKLFSGEHIKSIRELQEGKVDGIATYLGALVQEPTIDTADFRILYKTGLIPYNAYVFAPSLEQTVRDKIKDFMFNAHEDLGVYQRIFKNDLNISQWIEVQDDFYNGIRPLCGVRRSKQKVYVKFDNQNSILLNDSIVFLLQRCKEELMGSNRFEVIDQPNSNTKDSIILKIYNPSETVYSISVFLNKKLLFNYDQEIAQINAFPDLFVKKILEAFPIHTKIDFDNLNEICLVHYGLNDGITEEYKLIIDSEKEQIIVGNKNYSINDEYITLSGGDDVQFKKGNKVRIVYDTGHSEIDETNQESKSDTTFWSVFWSSLDTIWGIAGIFIAFLTVLITALFQMQKQRKFRKMLLEANNLLKDYFEGKEIISKIIDLRATIGSLLENQNIKEIQYNLLVNKLTEIQNIVESKSKIHDELKTDVEKIIADGIITEKEYQHLIHLIKSKNN